MLHAISCRFPASFVTIILLPHPANSKTRIQRLNLRPDHLELVRRHRLAVFASATIPFLWWNVDRVVSDRLRRSRSKAAHQQATAALFYLG